MSLNFVLFLVISFQAKLAISFVNCPPPQSHCENITTKNKTQVIETINCDLLNISCGFEKVCRQGDCVNVEPTSNSEGVQLPSTDIPTKYVTEVWTLVTRPNRHGNPSTTSHSLISGNQEFAIALVGFSILFINFCLISFCLARAKQRRLQQRRSATTQGSQTGNYWNDSHVTRNDASRREIMNMGIDNFALNGDMDGFSNEFFFPEVHLPPYDFNSAYDKPPPRSEDGEDDRESYEAAPDAQSINEDPPPYMYSDQRYGNSPSPPSYEDVLKVSATNVGGSTSGL